MLHHGNRQVKTLRTQGRQLGLLVSQGRQIYPGKRQELPQVEHRIVEDGGEKWFEVGFRSPSILTGNASAGWADARGLVALRIEQSTDLVAWNLGKMVDCATTAISNGDGTYDYWSRCIYPVDSSVKTGQLVVQSEPHEDARNAPFTALVINGVAQSLAHFPYTMPGHASQMQADLRAVGWTGATVVSSSASVWRIVIPNVEFSSYAIDNRIYWPVYLVANLYGDIVNPIDGRGLSGTFVNASGVPTSIVRQFFRVGITPQP